MDADRPEDEDAPPSPPDAEPAEQPTDHPEQPTTGFRPTWQRLMVWIVIGGIALWLIISGISGIIAKGG